ncbi:hypothetical protein RHECNPAF_280009 [Rhizobium etli CNPAF512]|nr:hypothetical protein RHECNPAF_280009 [Rhizobium etli CNPAF512]
MGLRISIGIPAAIHRASLPPALIAERISAEMIGFHHFSDILRNMDIEGQEELAGNGRFPVFDRTRHQPY